MAAQGQGRLLANRYRLRSEIGRGGMGTVWSAHDELLDREVAVKEVLLPPGLSPQERDVLYKRTFREARASARLNHPSVVTVHDVVSEGERPWIVMELVHARSLQDVLDAEGPLQPRRTAEIGRQVLAALTHAHRAGILHRDVKPSNVLVCEDDRAILTDFGIAQMEGDATLTQTGLVMGSPAYIPPERVQGERAVPASDLWALGATLYTCVEGKAPYERPDAMAALAAALSEEVPPPRNAGPLRPVLEGLLTRTPADRMSAQNAQTLLSEIAATRPPVSVASVTVASRSPAANTVLDEPHSAAKPAPKAEPESMETVKDPSALQILPPSTPKSKPKPEPRSMPQTGQVAPPSYDAQKYEAQQKASSEDAHAQRRTEVEPPRAPEPLPWAQQQHLAPPPPAYQPYTQPGQPAKPDHRGRAVFIILAVAILIAIALVVGAYILRGSSSSNSGSASTGGGGGRQHNSSNNSSDSTAYDTQRGSTFTVAVPKGWSSTPNGQKLRFTDPSGKILMEIDSTSWVGTAMDNATSLAARGPGNPNFPGYQGVGPTGVVSRDYADGNAADWEFTFDGQDGTRQHARDRFFAKSGHQYALYFRAPDSGWAAAQPYLTHALDSFTTTS